MKRIYIKLFFILSLLLGAASAYPKETADASTQSVLPSLDWQKMTLQREINNKVVEALSTIIKSNQFLVDVEIGVAPPVKPRFTPPDNQGADAGGADGGDNKGKVRPSTADPKDIPQDYVLFAKLGLEAPLIDDFEKDEKGKEAAKEKEKKKDLPAFEQLWKFNKALDIFNNLESVKIFVKLSEQLHQDTRASVKKVLNSLKFNLNEITPELDITYINMEEKLSTSGLPGSLAEFLALMAKFNTMIGLIIAAILLGIIAYLLFNKYAALQEELDQGGEMPAPPMMPQQEEKEKEEEEKGPDGLGGMGGELGSESADSYNGVERFQNFMEHSEVEAVMMVKRWLQGGSEKEKNALRALVQQMKNDSLIKLFQMLTPEERDTWKGCLDRQLVATDLPAVNGFISNQIVEDILVPAAITDMETLDILLKVSPEKAAEFVKEDPDLGRILMNVMSTKFVSKILENVEEEYMDVILTRSMNFKRDEIQSELKQFKEKLTNYQEVKVRTPFLEKVLELIPMAGPETESSLFKSITKAQGARETLEEVAKNYFPSALVPVLPDNVLKAILQQYPMNKKVELVASISEELKDKFVNIFAPAGSKAADMLDLEMEKVETDPVIQKRVTENKADIWKDFVDFTRRFIKADKDNVSTIENVLKQWIEGVLAGSTPEEAASGVDPDRTSVDEIKSAA